jgi:VanZ family protein
MEGTQTNTPADGRKQQPARLAGLWPYWPAVLVGMLLLYTFVLVIGTHLPKVGSIVRTPGVDKLLHFGAYAVQATLAGAAVASMGRLGRRNAAILIICLATFGGLDELTQPWFSRSAEWADWAADCLGIVLGVGLVLWLSKVSGRPSQLNDGNV